MAVCRHISLSLIINLSTLINQLIIASKMRVLVPVCLCATDPINNQFYLQVTSCKLWRQVGESFKPPKYDYKHVAYLVMLLFAFSCVFIVLIHGFSKSPEPICIPYILYCLFDSSCSWCTYCSITCQFGTFSFPCMKRYLNNLMFPLKAFQQQIWLQVFVRTLIMYLFTIAATGLDWNDSSVMCLVCNVL